MKKKRTALKLTIGIILSLIFVFSVTVSAANGETIDSTTYKSPFTTKNYKMNQSLQGYTVHHIIDVSQYNGAIDWPNIDSDVSGVIIRGGYRGWGTGVKVTDAKFTRNIQGATNQGIDIGVYWYTQAISKAEAIDEANYVLSLVKDYNLTLPIYIDVESSTTGKGRADNLTKAKRTEYAMAFCDTIAKAGYETGVYTSANWFKSKLNSTSLTKYTNWMAFYTTADPLKSIYGKYLPPYSMWQYSSDGKVDGISGRTDCNFLFVKGVLPVQKLTETSNTTSSITLSWNKVINATGYCIERYSNSEKKYVRLAKTTNGELSTYTDTGLATGTTYKYRVKAYMVDESGSTSGKYTTLSATTSPGKTKNVAVTEEGSSLKITWSKVPQATKYSVYRSENNGAAFKKIATITGTKYLDSNLTFNTEYQYKVRCYKSLNGTNYYGAYSDIKTGRMTKPQVTEVKSSSYTASSITLTWKGIGYVSGYRIDEYNAAVKNYDTVATVNSPDTTTYQVTNLNPGKDYSFKVTPYYVANGVTYWGKTSAAFKGSTRAVAPKNLAVNAIKGNSVTLTWDKAPSVTGYRIYRYDSATKQYVHIGTTPGTTYLDGDLKAKTTYQYKVRAYRNVNKITYFGTYSSVISAKTKPSTAKIGTVNVGTKLHMRSGPGTKYKIVTSLAKGSKVTVKATKGAWYKISATRNGKTHTGYASKTYIKL